MSTKDASISKGIDITVIWLYVFITLIGLLHIFIVEYKPGDDILQSFLGLKKEYSKQLLFIGIAALVAVFILVTDSKFFTTGANMFYVVGIVLMLATFVLGKNISGSKSWIPIAGGFNLQPAELCKIFVSLALAKYLSRLETNFSKPRSHYIAFAIALLPAVLSIAQKETGLALVYFSFFIVMFREGLPAVYLIAGFSAVILFIAAIVTPINAFMYAIIIIAVLMIYFLRRKIKKRFSIFWLVTCIAAGTITFQRYGLPYFFDNVLKPYQSKRVLSLFGIDYVPTDSLKRAQMELEERGKKKDNNYNVKQSKIAIGSGGFIGKGFLKGTQTRGEFVPEQHTDFIFTAVGETFGFWGSMLLLGIYFLLLMRLIVLAERQRSTFSRVYGYGVASVIFFHILINVGMTIGLMPVIGIPLPLMSYGGSSLLTFTILIFIFLRLDASRQLVLR